MFVFDYSPKYEKKSMTRFNQLSANETFFDIFPG